jgi:hypothetical protein
MIAELIPQIPITRIVVAHRPALIRRAKMIYEVGGRKNVENTGWSPLHALQLAAGASVIPERLTNFRQGHASKLKNKI